MKLAKTAVGFFGMES